MPALHSKIPQEIFKQVRGIEIKTRKLVNEIFSGQYSSIFKGKGMEFAQVREYQEGDDPKLIDWNVSAKTGNLHTKEFMEERELTVMIMIDASRSLFFGSRKNLKSEIAAELAALFAFSAIRNNDKVGLLIFTDRIEKFIPPRKGQRTILRLIREILAFEPEGNSTNLSAGIEFLGKVLKRRSICFLMSDFLTSEPYLDPLRALGKRHDLILVRLSDRLENEFPFAGRFYLQDLETQQVRLVNLNSLARLESLRNKARAQSEVWKKEMQKYGLDIIQVCAGEPYVSQLLSFFKTRARRLK